MELTLTDVMIVAAINGLVSFAGAWAAIKVHLRYLRRDVDRAHRRLNMIGAPDADPT